ncbi:MAG: methyl-accepting chemotaxis protein [bacterium]|nr:methyl-accepting chemotaxis protein [bacterium]
MKKMAPKFSKSLKTGRVRLTRWLAGQGLLSIGKRIGALVGLFALFMLGGFALTRWGYGLIEDEVNRIQQAQEVTALTAQVQLAVTAARGHEHTFLSEPSDQDASAFFEHLTEAQEGTRKLVAQDLSPEFAKAAHSLAETLASYQSDFQSVVDYNRSMGFGPNDGFRARFGESAEAIQAQFEKLGRADLVLALLKIRNAEKDFFLGRLSAGREVKEQMTELRQRLAQVRGAQALTKPAGLIDGYLSNFDRIKLYTYKVNDLEASFKSDFEEIPSLLAQLDQVAIDEQILVGKKAREVMQALGDRFLVMGLSTLVFMMFFGWALSRSILRPIKEVSALTEQLSQGNLTVRIKNQGYDELGQMSKSLNRFAVSLKRTIAVIHTGSDTLSAASHQLAATTRQIEATTQDANRSSEASNQSIQEVGRNVQDLAVSNEEITEALRELMQTAGQVSQEADQGKLTMARAAQAIEQIVAGQARIEKVLGAIEKISKQVHLLSFNAAIEAAKAGEAGRGFNVVAAEIRRLSTQTSQAVQEIDQVIKDSNDKVSVGASVVAEASDQFHSIMGDVQQINQGLSRIGASLVAQDYKTKNLARETDKISQLSERNSQVMFELAATIRQVDGTTGELSGMAGQLKAQVLVFKI